MKIETGASYFPNGAPVDVPNPPAQRFSISHLTRFPFQARVGEWMLVCFGRKIADDKTERNHRFLEESLELVQSLGCTASEAHQLVDYVFGRPIGEPNQESGGVSVTHAALCQAHGLDMVNAGELELARVWTMVDKIRAKQAAKPKHGPLPESCEDPHAKLAEAQSALADRVEAMNRLSLENVLLVDRNRQLSSAQDGVEHAALEAYRETYIEKPTPWTDPDNEVDLPE